MSSIKQSDDDNCSKHPGSITKLGSKHVLDKIKHLVKRSKSLSSKSMHSLSTNLGHPAKKKKTLKRVMPTKSISALDVRSTKLINDDVLANLTMIVKQLTVPGKGVIDISNDLQDMRTVTKDFPRGKTRQCVARPVLQEDGRQRVLSLYLSATRGSNLWFYVSGLLMQEEMVNFVAGRKNIRAFRDFNIKFGIKISNNNLKILPTFLGTAGEPANLTMETLEEKAPRLKELGVVFLHKTCNFRVTRTTPTVQAMEYNCDAAAKFCCVTQRVGLVPVLAVDLDVEAGVEADTCSKALGDILNVLMKSLMMHWVYKEGMIIQIRALPYIRPSKLIKDKEDISNPDKNDNAMQSNSKSKVSNISNISNFTIVDEVNQKLRNLRNDPRTIHLPLETRKPLKGKPSINMLQIQMRKKQGKLAHMYRDLRNGHDPRVTPAETRAKATALVVSRVMPAFIGGLMLTNEDTSMEESNDLLNQMNRCPAPRWPFHFSFCYRGVVQGGVISKWAGREDMMELAVDTIIERAKRCSLATMGQKEEKMGCLWLHKVTEG